MKKKKRVDPKTAQTTSSGLIYALGFIGSAVYYMLNSPNVWLAILGVLKSIIWPVFLVYEIMKFINM